MLILLQTIENESDRNLVEELYYQHYKTMLYTAKCILKDQSRAEDAVSEAFIKIINNLQKISFESCKKTRALAVIIVRNICYNMLKSENCHDTVPIEEFVENCDLEENAPLNIVISQETFDFVLFCLSKLDEIYQDILSLKLFYNYSDHEIAKILGITKDTVYVRYYRARKALMEEINKRGKRYEAI
jgi:RNA polymerase sigma-70 factor (ECF subfamily)